ncbi:MAG: PAS domain S-box protein [Ignavibacteriales bacterium]|nr:PAS domain S-box protein [Ignavibacteriales bacterium]
MNLSFSIYVLLSLVPTLTNIAFAVFVYFENPRSAVNRLWSLTIACLIPWGLGEVAMRSVNNFEIALVASRIGGIGFCIIPALFLHFSLAYCRLQHALQYRWLLPALYLPAIVFAVLQVSESLTQMISLSWGFVRTPSIAYPYYLIWLEILFGTGLYLCFRKFHRAETIFERKQTLFVILAVLIPLGAGSINDAILPLLGVETVRISVLSTTVTAGLITYAIVRYRLMALTPQATATSILDTMGDLLAVVDEKGVVQYTNSPFRRHVLDRKGEAALSIGDFMDGHTMLNTFAQLNTPQESKTVRIDYRTANGTIIPVSLVVSGIFDRGETIGYILLARDITEELRLQQDLHRATQERTADLKRYAISIQRVLEEERLRIARELHDDLCQRLTGMKLELLAIAPELPKSHQAAGKSLRNFIAQIRRMIVDVRRISYDLRPTSLDDFGLVTALKMLCSDFQRSHDLDVRFETTVNGTAFNNQQVEIALYRIAQEALSNAVLHGRAKQVCMRFSANQSIVKLTVEDDGAGMEPPEMRGRGLGLMDMRERAELLGGSFSITSKSSKGTRIHVEIPNEQIPI